MRRDVSYFTILHHGFKPGDRFISVWDGAEFRVSKLYGDSRFSAVPWTWWDSLKAFIVYQWKRIFSQPQGGDTP